VIFTSGLMRWVPYGVPEWVRERLEDEHAPGDFYRSENGVIYRVDEPVE